MKEKIKNKLRTMGLTNFAVDNATSVFLLTLMIVIFGISSYEKMPKEQFPEIDWPQVFVNTVYFGNSAVDMENLVTRPIEKELNTISGIKNVFSTSMPDVSFITAEFESDVELTEATRRVKDAVDKAKSELPKDLTRDPEVIEINLSEIPIMAVNLSGDFTNDELKGYAEYLEDRIEEVPEISDVNIKGALDREVKIDVDLPKMQALKVSFTDIENAIKSENLTMSSGELLMNDFRRSVRVVGEFKNIAEIENLIVKSEGQRPIVLKDIASVRFDFKDRKNYARVDQQPVFSLDVIKRSGANLLNAADKIKVIIDKAKRDVFPENLKVSIFNDQSIHVRRSVANLENSIISGMILVVLVLLFFLGLRNASFVGMAIPLSMLMGVMILHVLGITLNMVVLFSLILALGMLVDNGIVVVENIYRYRQNGYSGKEASKFGTGEVAIPIIVSTATTLVAFLPLAFWPGVMGSFMQYLPITLIIVLLSSLFVALVVNPVFTANMMKVDTEDNHPANERKRKTRNVLIGTVILFLLAVVFHFSRVNWMRNLLVLVALITLVNYFFLNPAAIFFQRRVVTWMERVYDRFIRFALKKAMPYVFFFGTIGLLFFAFALLRWFPPKVVFFADADPQYVNVFVDLPLGTDIEATNKVVKQLEKKIENALDPYHDIVDAMLTQIGENTADPNGPPEPGDSPQKARITVAFVPDNERGNLSSADAMDAIREGIKGLPGVKLVVDKNKSGPPAGKPVNLEIKGDDVSQLMIVADELIAHIEEVGVPGIEKLKADVQLGKPEMIVNIDREAARRYGISTWFIADAIRTSIFGKEASKYKKGDEEYPIMIRLDEKYRNNIDDLLNLKITFRNPANGRLVQVPISSVANVKFTSTYSAIKRKNLDRMVTVSSNVLDGYNANEIVEELKGMLADYPFPKEMTYEFTGEQKEQAENTAFLVSAFMVALFSIFLLLVAQFDSLISPFIIIFSVIFSTIGVFLGYIVNGQDIVIVMTGVGLISLAGVVVNNAIVLIDYTNVLMARTATELGLKSTKELSYDQVKEVIIKAGATRLRPVLLTAITTVFGMIPLAVGFNFDFFSLISELDPHYFVGGDNVSFWGPLAWTVIYGLVFATFLTLVVVPVMYWLAYKLKTRVLGLMVK